MSRRRSSLRWFALASVVTVALGVAVVVISMTGTDRGRVEATSAERREAFCAGLNLQIDNVIASFDDAPTDSTFRKTAEATLGLVFSEAFVAGAPDELRATAADLRRRLFNLVDGPASPDDRDHITTQYRSLDEQAKDVCTEDIGE